MGGWFLESHNVEDSTMHKATVNNKVFEIDSDESGWLVNGELHTRGILFKLQMDIFIFFIKTKATAQK
ncbi:MAG: hypothetical protein U5K54_19755 [Cytophagales bacterium]|nr:hypothetical protein [Cytophagales bacterium]